jgi:hypothetical protein
MAARSETAAADTYRLQQVLISATLTRDLIRLLKALFNPANPGPSWAVARMAIASLIRDRRRQSADLAARYYPTLRSIAGVHTPVQVAPPIELVDDRLMANIDATGIGMYQKALRAGATQAQALDRAGVTLSGTGSRLALEGGRSVIDETVKGDGKAIGWIRITDAAPCSWCLMMASRGAVYRSAETAGRAKASHFAGGSDFAWHDHCGCTAAPVFSDTDPRLDHADALYDQWLQATQGHSGQAAINAWRRYWDNRDSAQQGAK